MVSYHHVQYQIELIIQSRENLIREERTDREMDRQTGESNFIGRCPTDVERTNREQDKIVKLQMFDTSYILGKSHFSDDGGQII